VRTYLYSFPLSLTHSPAGKGEDRTNTRLEPNQLAFGPSINHLHHRAPVQLSLEWCALFNNRKKTKMVSAVLAKLLPIAFINRPTLHSLFLRATCVTRGIKLYSITSIAYVFYNCPWNEMKLKRNSLKTVLKLFLNCFVSVSLLSADRLCRRQKNDINTIAGRDSEAECGLKQNSAEKYMHPCIKFYHFNALSSSSSYLFSKTNSYSQQ